MCGINVLIRHDDLSLRDLDAVTMMNSEMPYRGPDSNGLWHDTHAALGHVRLSIIGVDNGEQPLYNEQQDLVLVCNGEIFNYRELRSDLESKGHRFATLSDCEVIIHLYEEMGTGSIRPLRGMYAFCLWDVKQHVLFAARDRCGQKPLYYYEMKDGIVFSSEIKAIRKHFIENPQANNEVLRQTLTYSYPLDQRHTQIVGIKRVIPGELMLVERDRILHEKYWERKLVPTFRGDLPQAKTAVVDFLRDAVRLRMQSEVPVAVLLSGGVDSSAIACLAKESCDEVHALTVGYKGDHSCDERLVAQRLAKEKGLVWHEIELSVDDYHRYFEEYTAVLDEPVADSAALAQWGIYAEAKKLGFKVLLSGNGGDELFYGYQSHNEEARFLALLDLLRAVMGGSAKSSLLQQELQEGLSCADITLFLKNILKNARAKYKGLLNMRSLGARSEHDSLELNPSDFYKGRDSDYIDRIYAFLFNVWLPGNCYILADKLGMGNSLEVRSPFADHILAEFVFSLPLKYRYVVNKPKDLLRESMRGIVPDFILDERKRGFTPPLAFIREIAARHDFVNHSLAGQGFRGAVIDQILNDRV